MENTDYASPWNEVSFVLVIDAPRKAPHVDKKALMNCVKKMIFSYIFNALAR